MLPAAAATGGALRLRLLTAAGVPHPDAVFLATIEGTGSALLLYTMLGVALVVSLPVHGVDPRQRRPATSARPSRCRCGRARARVGHGP